MGVELLAIARPAGRAIQGQKSNMPIEIAARATSFPLSPTPFLPRSLMYITCTERALPQSLVGTVARARDFLPTP